MGSTEGDGNRKKIGVIGLGSIGVRHCLALKELGVTDIYALRTNKGNKVIPVELEGIVKSISNVSEFDEVDGFIIANPTALHIDALKKIIGFNKPVFIEKPLCNDLADLSGIGDELNHIYIQIGFCLRFNNVIKKVKEIIESKAIGQIYHCRMNVGQFLPLWHPYADYREEYFSKKELGGGAVRTLSHEMDLAQFFFGQPTALKAYSDKVSNLDIDVDDYTCLLLNYNDALVVRIEMDFLSKKVERYGKIYGTELDLTYDVFDHKIELHNKEGKLEKEFNISHQDMYQEQMKTFLDHFDTQNKGDISVAATLEESIFQLDLIKGIENYSLNNQWVKI